MWTCRITQIIISILSFSCLLVSPSPTPPSSRLTLRAEDLPPDSGSLSITNITYSGSGCKPNSGTADVSLAVSELDAYYLSITYTNLSVSSAPSSTHQEFFNTSTCEINFVLHYPSSWGFTVPSATLDGYRVVNGTHVSRGSQYIWSEGEEGVFSLGSMWGGPYDDWFELVDKMNSTVTGCTAPEEGVVKEGNESAFTVKQIISVDLENDGESFGSLDVRRSVLELKWEKCPPKLTL